MDLAKSYGTSTTVKNMNKTIEKTILSHLICNEDYCRKVIPFIKEDYFTDKNDKVIYQETLKFIQKYNKTPTTTSIQIEIDGRKDLNEAQFKEIREIVSSFEKEDVDIDWLSDTTENWCKDKAIYNAIVDGISIIEGRDKNRKPDALPTLLTDALAVSFDNRVGHDYLKDSNERFDYYHKIEERIPFDLEFFNKITKGGLPQKTLNVALAGTGVGKSLFMCHMASNCLSQGKNVLYITLEMAEERIAERIDANLMNISIDDLHDLPKTMYEDKIDKVKKRASGNLIIKEYPTASAHTNHFRQLIQELAIKKSFRPDIIFVDYLNICASSRFRGGSNINSYTIIKAIAEELRGLAVENNLPIVTATQTTRSGFVSTDIGLEDTSESFGLPATADFMFALISTDELEELNQIAVKQLKNRYNDPTSNKRFVLGVDRARMKLYDVEMKAQNDIVDKNQEEDDTPLFDKSTIGSRYEKFQKLKV